MCYHDIAKRHGLFLLFQASVGSLMQEDTSQVAKYIFKKWMCSLPGLTGVPGYQALPPFSLLTTVALVRSISLMVNLELGWNKHFKYILTLPWKPEIPK